MINFFKKLWQGETDGLTAAAFIIGAASIASRVVGIVRDRTLAATFGAGDMLDAYYAAFRLPDTVYNLVILGALSAGFVPVFAEWFGRKGKEQALKLASRVLATVGFGAALVCVMLFIFAPQIVPLITPGYTGVKLDLAIELTRIMLGSPILLGLSAVMGGILQSTRRFVAYALAPVLYNFGIILGILVIGPEAGIRGAAWGVLAGAALHLIAQWSAVRSLGRLGWSWPSVRDQGVRQMWRMAAPRIFGLAISQISFIIVLALATTAESGAVAVFNLANNIQSFPIGVFGISFAIAAFPIMSAAAAAKDYDRYISAFSSAARKIVFLTLPAMAIFILLRAQIIRLILGQGAFNWSDTIRTADVLAWFALSLVAQALIPLLARAYFAKQDVKVPIAISVVAEIINVALAAYLVRSYGATGLAMAFSTAALFQAVALFAALRRRGPMDGSKILLSFYKTTIATVALCVAAYPMRQWLGTIYPLRTVWQVALQGFAAGIVGLVVFLLTAWIVRSPELAEFAAAIRKRLWRQGNVGEGTEKASGMA